MDHGPQTVVQVAVGGGTNSATAPKFTLVLGGRYRFFFLLGSLGRFFPCRKSGPGIYEAPTNDENASFKKPKIEEKTSKIMVWGGPGANVAPCWRPGGPKGRPVCDKVVRWTPPPAGDPNLGYFLRKSEKSVVGDRPFWGPVPGPRFGIHFGSIFDGFLMVFGRPSGRCRVLFSRKCVK